MGQIVSCEELRRSKQGRRSEFRDSAVEGIRLCQEDLLLVRELKTVHVL
jgi:hypothetical protein